MTDFAISAEGLGKRYHLGRDQDPYGRLSEVLSGMARAPFRRRVERPDANEFWALRDVAFEIPVVVVVLAITGLVRRTRAITIARPVLRCGSTMPPPLLVMVVKPL